MDTGARSATAAGIRLPRYPPGKQTKGVRRPLSIIRSEEFVESKLLCDESKRAPAVCYPAEKVTVLSESMLV